MAYWQARSFAAMLLCGFSLTGVYDSMMMIVRAGRVWAGCMDLVFGVLMAAGVTVTALILRIDPFRFYVLMGTGTGMMLWRITGGLLLRKVGVIWRRYALIRTKNDSA